MLLYVFFSFICIKGYKPQGSIIQGKKKKIKITDQSLQLCSQATPKAVCELHTSINVGIHI